MDSSHDLWMCQNPLLFWRTRIKFSNVSREQKIDRNADREITKVISDSLYAEQEF